MAVNVGDTIVMRAKTKRLAPGARQGIIEEVLDATQPRLVVRWSDGRTTVIAPSPDAFRIEPAKAKRASTARKPAAAKAAAAKKTAPAKPLAAKTAPKKPAAKAPAAKAAAAKTPATRRKTTG